MYNNIMNGKQELCKDGETLQFEVYILVNRQQYRTQIKQTKATFRDVFTDADKQGICYDNEM